MSDQFKNPYEGRAKQRYPRAKYPPGVMLGTEIEPLDNEEVEYEKHEEDHWWYLCDSEMHWVHCTCDQRFYDENGDTKQAQDFEPGDIIVHRTGNFEITESGNRPRFATKVELRMKRIHLFWANGFLSHT